LNARAWLAVLGMFAVGCSKPYENGYAVDLIVGGSSSVSKSELQMGQTLAFVVSGADEFTYSYTLAKPFAKGEERIVYRPKAESGEVTFSATLTDASDAFIGSATGEVTLDAGKTVTLHLDLEKAMPPDLAGTNVGFYVDRASYDFGVFAVGQSVSPHVFVVTNASKTTSGAITIGGAADDLGVDTAGYAIAADHCSGQTLAPNTSCAFAVALDTAQVGAPTATLLIDGGAAGTASTVLSATILAPGVLAESPLSGDFGSIQLAQKSTPRLFTFTNFDSVASGSLSVTFDGDDATMFSSSGCAGLSLTSGQSCTVSVTFAPSATATPGDMNTSLRVAGVPSGTASVALSGKAIAPGGLAISPTMVDFGKVDTGATTAPTSFTITNTSSVSTGTLTTTMQGDTSQFTATDACNGKPLAASASCTIQLAFVPADMTSILVLTVADASGHSVSAKATGTGGQFAVLTVSRTGAGTLVAPGIDCGSDCSEPYAIGQVVTLTAAPDITSRFGGWTGSPGTPCVGTNLAVCTFTMSGPVTLGATFTTRPAQNIAFASSTTVIPMSLGATGDPQAAGDAFCATRAVQGGLSGAYKAYLATTTTSAIAHLGTASGWVRTDGNAFALTQASLGAGQILYPLRLDETGTVLADDPGETTGSATVATGTSTTGAVVTTGNCTNWTATGSYAYGIATAGTDAWNARANTQDCTKPAHLYCFETTYATGVTLTKPTTYRHAFLTEGVTNPPFSTNGIADGDTLCNTQKTTYNTGGGTFLAALTPTGATAASRFTTTAGSAPWARPDGVLLASTAAGLFTSSILAAPNVTASGVYVGFTTDDPRLSIGSATGIAAVGVDTENCGNWMGTGGNQTAYGGRVMWSDARWANEASELSGCVGGNTVHILCLEE
jgi:hypothetical protein